MIYIKRFITSELLQLINHFPVVGIIGPRQVGKTTLAKRLRDQIDKQCLYLDLELPEDLNKLSEPELYLSQHIDKCIILDEIQRMSELLPVLRGLIDKNRIPGRFILLGSSSPSLIRNSSESLAGRIAYKELSPFNLIEIEKQVDLPQHWFLGGFPEALLAPDKKLARLWIRNFIQAYTERDLPLLGLSASPAVIRRLWTMLAHFHGGIWNANSFANAIGVTIPTVNRYVNFLEEAFLVTRLEPFYLNIKKRLVKSPKIYIRDSGILHYITGITNFEQLQGHVLIGNSWEGYVIEQIKQVIGDEIDLYFYRTHNGTESDLVLVNGSQPISCIEIKYTSAPKISKGYRIAISDLGTGSNFIITPQSESYQVQKNITVCNLDVFLTEFIPELYK